MDKRNLNKLAADAAERVDSDDNQTEPVHAELLVGTKLRYWRNQRGLSLRMLAERSGLNINTLSLVENGKSSPSVSTLQQLALALDVPITSFFESEPREKQVVFTSHENRPVAMFDDARMCNLGKDLTGNAIQPFVVTLASGGGSGEKMIVHTGYEFVYCLSGKVLYNIDGEIFRLKQGDSVVFESHLPHCWQNDNEGESQIILVISPTDQREAPGGRHFIVE